MKVSQPRINACKEAGRPVRDAPECLDAGEVLAAEDPGDVVLVVLMVLAVLVVGAIEPTVMVLAISFDV